MIRPIDRPLVTPTNAGRTPHVPVLLADVLNTLAPTAGETYVDGTFGAGGYTRAILESADCRVISLDRDPSVADAATKVATDFGTRFQFIAGRFGDMAQILSDAGIDRVDGIVLDIGVSSMQLDQPDRGFSFRDNGPLDMRMSRQGKTAADLVNETDEEDLANLIYRYGEERFSRRIARSIVEKRAAAPFVDTKSLAETIRAVVPTSKDGIDPATRTFQALRIVVNDELGELERALSTAEHLLAPGGRLAVVSFHSLEDRIVKTFLRNRSGAAPSGSRHLPQADRHVSPPFRLVERRARKASDDEIRRNSRARSARLRWAVRTDAPPSDNGGAGA